jgi:hypothetical protein
MPLLTVGTHVRQAYSIQQNNKARRSFRHSSKEDKTNVEPFHSWSKQCSCGIDLGGLVHRSLTAVDPITLDCA